MQLSPLYGLGFEVKGIQPVIMEGGRLRDMVAASELIDGLAAVDGADRLEDVLEALGLRVGDDVWVARRGGAAWTLLSDDRDKLIAVRRLWTLTVQVLLPGVETVSAPVPGDDEITVLRKIGDALEVARAEQEVMMPVTGPLLRRAPRTGRPSVGYEKRGRERTDELTLRKRQLLDRGATNLDRLTRKLEPNGAGGGWKWPTVFELAAGDDPKKQVLFPLGGEQADIGIIHADGNGFGMLLRGLMEELQTAPNVCEGEASASLEALSRAIAEVTRDAAREASREVLAKGLTEDSRVPARPIVLGGDDLTLIVRGDLALDYVQAFLRAFEQGSAKAIEELGGGQDLPALRCFLEGKSLSACAGVAFIKATQPFDLGYRLAESLCAYAKSVAKRDRPEDKAEPSCIAFHRVTTSILDSFLEVRGRELTVPVSQSESWLLSMQPYAIQAGTGLPALDHLRCLRELLSEPEAGVSKLRQILGDLAHQPHEAREDYKRWYRVRAEEEKRRKKEGDKGENTHWLDKLAELLKTRFQVGDVSANSIGLANAERLLGRQDETVVGCTPLFDALSWRALERQRPVERSEDR